MCVVHTNGPRAQAKYISQRSRAWVGGGAKGDKASTTLKPFAEQYRTSSPETVRASVLHLQCFPCIAIAPLPSYIRFTAPMAWPFRVVHKFSLARTMQFQINYASGCPWRAVGRRIILRQFTPPQPKEAANKPASISRHAIPLSAHGAHGVQN